MRAVVQRVVRARVTVGDRVTGEIGPGLLVLVGVSRHDTASDAASVAAKVRDMRKGRRPSFDEAAAPAVARDVYGELVRELRTTGLTVETGEFQAMMQVELVNDGPVTILIDSTKQF